MTPAAKSSYSPVADAPIAAWYSWIVFTDNPFACNERMPFTLAAAALRVVMIGTR